MLTPQIKIPLEKLEQFCRKWQISELSLFGSVLTDDFTPNSDVDVLVSFEDDASCSLYEWIDMIEELRSILGREIDLVEKEGLRNPYRRHSILSQRQVLYAA